MASGKIIFEGSTGENLSAKLDSPDGEISSYALFAHCFSSGKDLSAISRVAKALNNEGIALFRFDFTGLGSSGGDFANTNFSSNVEDLVCAAKYMRENLKAPDIMIGHSFGGTATLVAANQVPEVKAVATIGAPFDTTNIFKQFGCSLAKIKKEGEAEIKLAGRTFKIKKQFIDDAKKQNIKKVLKSMKKPLLIMHSPVDDTVNISHAKKMYQAASHPKSFISLDKADHLLMKEPKDGKYVAELLAAWSSRYVE